MLEFTVNAPPDPAVCETSVRVDWPLLVTTPAVTPIAAALMALARPEIVLLPESVGTLTICAAPLPT